MITLSTTIEEVYSAFFYTTLTYTLCKQSDEILFGCFVTTLNTAFEWGKLGKGKVRNIWCVLEKK